jgi:hypothetical protein
MVFNAFPMVVYSVFKLKLLYNTIMNIFHFNILVSSRSQSIVNPGSCRRLIHPWLKIKVVCPAGYRKKEVNPNHPHFFCSIIAPEIQLQIEGSIG